MENTEIITNEEEVIDEVVDTEAEEQEDMTCVDALGLVAVAAVCGCAFGLASRAAAALPEAIGTVKDKVQTWKENRKAKKAIKESKEDDDVQEDNVA